MATIAFIGLIIIVFALICISYIWQRNDAVYKFRVKMIDLCWNHTMRHRNDPPEEKEKNYSMDFFWRKYAFTISSYYKMLFSFKPLTIEEWFPKEAIEKLKS